MDDDFLAWLAGTLGHRPHDPAPFRRALTHASRGEPNYERLEFLGDRVLGLTAAEWLYERFPDEPEGALSRRINMLVSRESCAEVGRAIGADKWLRLGKQARDDGANRSYNVVGDAVEALLGALFLDAGLEGARRFVRMHWDQLMAGQHQAPRHPKSALQEWAAANGCRPPVYTLAGRAGPHHAPTFRVAVEIPGRWSVEAEGASKQEAETEAARRLLEALR